MKFVLILLATALAGCVHTPQSITESGVKLTVTSKFNPQAAADCMARNGDEVTYPAISTKIRPGQAAGVVEVVGSDEGGTLVFARAVPAGTGSQITVWTSPNLPSFWGGDMGRKLVEKC